MRYSSPDAGRRLAIVAVILIGLAAACSDTTSGPPAGGVPASLAAVTPLQVSGIVATEVTPAPTVRVTDAEGSPVAGVRVTFKVTAGGAVALRVVDTDADGRATVVWKLGNVAMGYSIAATVANLAPVVFSAVAAPGPIASILAVDWGWQAGRPASPLSRPVTAKVVDAYGNPVAGATVLFDVVSGGGTLERATATSDSFGLATSGTWTLGATVGVQRVRARVGGIEVVYVAETFGCSPEVLDAPCVAPKQLVFASLTDRQIYTISADGNWLSRLTNEGQNLRPAWAPDGRRIAFVRHDDKYVGDIYLMDADGKNVVRRTAAADFWSAAWSPDGRKLAVSTEGVYYSDIWLITADDDGSPPVHLASDARSPAWSPDGKKIAYVHTSGDDGYDAIYVMNADGTGATPLTAPWGGRYGMAWSPDGRRIASSICERGVCNVIVMNADGSDVRRLTDVGTAQEAAWSPDGDWIAISLWTYSGGNTTVSLAYIPATGGAPRDIASGGYHPSWRP